MTGYSATSSFCPFGSTFAKTVGHLVFAVTVASVCLLGTVPPAEARAKACSRTTRMGLLACTSEVREDFFAALGVCANVPREERGECRAEAREERAEARQLCRDQSHARRDLCEKLGEDRYDPDFDSEDFQSDFANPSPANPHWPLQIGDHWEYEAEDETIVVEVLAKTKLIEGVTCVVVNDRVEEDGHVTEDTDDWYALAKDGTVNYCGEISQEFEHFAGDDPEEPELVEIEGSWKAGNDGQKSGILMQSPPEVGQVYRQEWAFLTAEDAAEVLSTTYGFGNDAELDAHVPEDLAILLCNDNCVVTRDFTPIEPDASERKYYAPGIGLFLEVDEGSGEIAQLIDCNVDPLCGSLPSP